MSLYLFLLVTVVSCVCRLPSTEGNTGLPKVSNVNHYEPLSYDPSPLRDKHDRIARGVIEEEQIRHIQLHFRAYQTDFHLFIKPSRSVFSSGAVFKINGKTNSSYNPLTFYKGVLRGDESSRVSGHVLDGVFSGIIRSSRDTYHIETTASHFPTNYKDLPFHSFIYSEADVSYPRQPAPCGVAGATQDWMDEVQSSATPLQTSGAENPRTKRLTELLKGRDRRALTATGGTYCHMRVAVDHLFYEQIGGGNQVSSLAEVVTVFDEVQQIYFNTDFDNDGTSEQIRPSIQEFDFMQQSDPGYRFSAPSIAVSDFLDLWSQEDHTGFCLALLLTNRDFDDGVLGLAWVAQPPGGNRGGICEGRVRLSVGERTLNTAIMTYTNYGSRQPRAVSVVTMAHEIGHNFGSPHDPTTSQCSPGGSSGNYIMFPRATNGQQNNNNLFSPCSRSSMRSVLDSSKSSCFSNEAFCGNNIIEEGEECDHQDDVTCCNTTICMLLPGKACSSEQPCCNDNCEPVATNMICQSASDCLLQSRCNVNDAATPTGACPDAIPHGAGTLCNNGSNVCDAAGQCIGSYCLNFQGLSECQCSTDLGFSDDQLCHVCCERNGECFSTFDVELSRGIPGPGPEGRIQNPGRSCNGFQGYCSQANKDGNSQCIEVDNEETLNDLIDLLSIETLNNIVAWLTVYWWVAIIIILAILALFILLQVTYRKRKPLKRRLSRARNSLRGRPTPQEEGGRREERARRRGRERRDAGRRQLSPDEALRRLTAFFPTADRPTISDVIRVSASEAKAVRRLLELGFPLKRVPIPHA